MRRCFQCTRTCVARVSNYIEAPSAVAGDRSIATFEVASVKPSTSGINGLRGGCRGIHSKYNLNDTPAAPPLGRCVITEARLSHLIAIAYGLHSMGLMKGASDWVIAGSERFTVQAKGGGSCVVRAGV